MTKAIGVLLALKVPLFRRALRDALQAEGDFHVVAETGYGTTAVELAKQTQPGLVILDADLPDAPGVQICSAIKSAGVPARVMILSDGSEQAVLLRAVEAGADAYLTKSSSVPDILAAARLVDGGSAWVPPDMLGLLLRDLIKRRREDNEVAERFGLLSKREFEVLSLLAEGRDHREIGTALYVSPHTARTHIQNLLEKLGVHSRLEAVALAMQHGILEGPSDHGAGQ